MFSLSLVSFCFPLLLLVERRIGRIIGGTNRNRTERIIGRIIGSIIGRIMLVVEGIGRRIGRIIG